MMQKKAITLDEPLLADEYPVWCGNAYVADGKVIESPGSGTIAELKVSLGAKEIRRCDIVGRGLSSDFGFRLDKGDQTHSDAAHGKRLRQRTFWGLLLLALVLAFAWYAIGSAR